MLKKTSNISKYSSFNYFVFFFNVSLTAVSFVSFFIFFNLKGFLTSLIIFFLNFYLLQGLKFSLLYVMKKRDYLFRKNSVMLKKVYYTS